MRLRKEPQPSSRAAELQLGGTENLSVANGPMHLCHFFVKILLEAGKRFPDFLRRPKVNHCVGNGVVVFKPKQGCKLVLVEFFHAHFGRGIASVKAMCART